jgi:hypothetical protein
MNLFCPLGLCRNHITVLWDCANCHSQKADLLPLPLLIWSLRNEQHFFALPAAAEAPAPQKLLHVETTLGRPCAHRRGWATRWTAEREEVDPSADQDRAHQPACQHGRYTHGGWLLRACEMGSSGTILHPCSFACSGRSVLTSFQCLLNHNRWRRRQKSSRTSCPNLLPPHMQSHTITSSPTFAASRTSYPSSKE